MSRESEFTIGFDDVDPAVLPADARAPGSARFLAAVGELVEKELGGRGGWARIVVDEGARVFRVSWGEGAGARDPLDAAVRQLGRGEYEPAIRTLEVLRLRQPENVAVLFNLGMALSDRGRLSEAVKHLRKAAGLAPADGNVRTALGVALARSGQTAAAVEALREAVGVAPSNAVAHRNLGGCLLREGKAKEAEPHLRKAVELSPKDAAARVGLGQCLVGLDRTDEADEQLIEAIRLDERGPVGEAAKEERTRLAQRNFRTATPGTERPDAVMYCLGAIRKFEKMPPEQVQKVGFEIAILGMSGINPNDPDKTYRLKSLPGDFTGLHLLCIMYVAFKIIAPDHDTGFDVSREYRAALAMHESQKGPGSNG